MSARPLLFRARAGRSPFQVLPALAGLLLAAGACSGVTQSSAASLSVPNRPVLHEATDATIGVSNSAQGYTFDSAMATLPADMEYRFRILGPDGAPQTGFLYDQTKFIHFLAVRNDLTNFAHVHPTMAPDGTWTVHLPLASAGPYQVYVDFLIKDAQSTIRHMVLRRPLVVEGGFRLAPILPAPSMSGDADGYRITFLTQPKAWTVMLIPARITRTDGTPVTDLEPYLAVFAHFTAFKQTNDLYGHAHPLEYAGAGREGWPPLKNVHGGPNLTFHAEFPGAGDYRAFVEFQVAGQLHTAALTMHVS